MRNECRTRTAIGGPPRAVLAAVLVAILALQGCERSSSQGDPPLVPAAQASTGETVALEPEGASPTVLEPEQPPVEATPAPVETGTQLFARHCAACHGDRGDGKGIAAAFLFPKPRDLRAGRFRLVSTDNNVPARDDLHAVLIRGMPGSSMPPWAHLSQSEREALVDEIMHLRREGARDSYIQQLKEVDDLTDEEIESEEVRQEIQEYVADFTTPGQSTDVPETGAPTAESIARGKEAYAKFACNSCHGESGRGDGVQKMFDDEKLPTSPRDFTLGIFKGEHDPASLYRRIAYGMPGTPMPGSSGMTPEQMADLVHYIRSLSTEENRQAAILKRERIIAKRVDSVPESAQSDSWNLVEPVSLRMAPLWWRDDADPVLSVQVIHDGQSIAVRMSWADETLDHHAARSEAFEDAVALELYPDKPEPFLGMGDGLSPVDVWFWDADRQRSSAADDKTYPNAVVDVFPFSEEAVESAELNRPGARVADQPEMSLPARASGNLIAFADEESGGSSLHASGPSTVTFRVPQSQLVRAHGSWVDGRWTVIMTRALSAPSPVEGLSLQPGDCVSVAFAVWDGAHRDRDGQKSITIWQDLEIDE